MSDPGALIFGPLLVGTFLGSILYGTFVVQVYMYFQTYKSDKTWTKAFIIYLLLCESLGMALDIGIVFEPLVLRYGTPQALTKAPLMLAAHPVLTVMISLPVQLFIAWRVKVISKSSVIPAIIALFALASFAGGIATTVMLVLVNFQYSRFHQNDGSVISWLAPSAVADVLITISLVYSLLRKRTGFATTDTIINRIIRMTIQTGLMTAVFAMLDIALFVALYGSWNFIFDLFLSKLYSNTILSTLNARKGWKATSAVQENVLFGNVSYSGARSHPQIEISMATEIQSQESSNVIPMKVLDSESSFVQEAPKGTDLPVEYREGVQGTYAYIERQALDT